MFTKSYFAFKAVPCNTRRLSVSIMSVNTEWVNAQTTQQLSVMCTSAINVRMGERCPITSPTHIYPNGWWSNRPPFGYKSMALTSMPRLPHISAQIGTAYPVFHVGVYFPNASVCHSKLETLTLLLWFHHSCCGFVHKLFWDTVSIIQYIVRLTK